MIGQVLSEPMRKNECYEFNIALARSMTYEGYNQPVKFRLWGGFSLGDKKNLLIESQQAISHSDWKLYNYFFFAQDNYTYILIEPYYANAQGLPYRGNLLLDGLTTFKRCLRADEQNDSDNH
jgi:hypothetical protein